MNGTRIIDVEAVAVPVADRDQASRPPSRWSSREGLPLGAQYGITLTTSDAQTDHADLRARGVDVDELLRWPGVPAMFAFHDHDGNELKIIETS